LNEPIKQLTSRLAEYVALLSGHLLALLREIAALSCNAAAEIVIRQIISPVFTSPHYGGMSFTEDAAQLAVNQLVTLAQA